MISINTNIDALRGQNALRMAGDRLSVNLERLSSGLRINHGKDDPSGLAIATGMKAQMSGLQMAISNTQDTISLLQTAESYLHTVSDMLIRMRDLCVRLANQATLTSNPAANPFLPANNSDSRTIRNEMVSLRDELERLANTAYFNGKNLLYGDFASGLQYAQIGPNNTSSDQFNVVLADLNGLMTSLTAMTNPFDPPSDATEQEWIDFALGILSDIDETNSLVPVPNRYGLPSVSNAIANIGVQERVLTHVLNDLNTQYINIAAAHSRIADADMAEEISSFTRNQILAQAATAITAQANTSQKVVLSLLNYI